MSEEKDLVAVMLPREYVASQAGFAVDRDNSPFANELIAACKRALRPEPPTDTQRFNLRNKGVLGDGRVAISNWIEYVLEHGWEAE